MQKEIHSFWRSGRKFDEFLRDWGIFDIDDFWRRFDEEDLIERKKMIENGEIYLFKDASDIINELKDENDIKLGIISNTPASIANLELDLIDFPYDKISIYNESISHTDFNKWLVQCNEYFESIDKTLIIIIDGLDHVWREKKSLDELNRLFD